MKQRLLFVSVALLSLTTVAAPALSAVTEQEHEAIVETLDAYLRASYARDAGEAYRHLSQADRTVKTTEEYVDENGRYFGFALQLSKQLALLIELRGPQVSIDGNRATVEFGAILPDANHPSLSDIVQGFNSDLLEVLDDDERKDRLAKLHTVTTSDQFAVLESDYEQWELIRENGQWRVFVNWADAIEVVFRSIVSDSLGWEFYPAKNLVLAQPGQTIQMSYIAVNVGDKTTTGKARHTVRSTDVAEYLEIVACFCFMEQSLEVGESVELPLVFRVDYEVPEEVDGFTVDYEFFLESEFPSDEVS